MLQVILKEKGAFGNAGTGGTRCSLNSKKQIKKREEGNGAHVWLYGVLSISLFICLFAVSLGF